MVELLNKLYNINCIIYLAMNKVIGNNGNKLWSKGKEGLGVLIELRKAVQV